MTVPSFLQRILLGNRGLPESADFGCGLFLLTFIYAICAVSSFALETGGGRCARAVRGDERGERLLLLDHAAHSSLLSAAQLNKLTHGTRTHFV